MSRRFLIEMLAGYSLFSSLAIVGRIARPVLGELADVLLMSAALWPYGLMLALQTWIPPGSWFGMFFVGGLLLTILWGIVLQRRFPALSRSTWWSHACALVLWCVPLVLLEAVVVGAVWAAGFPIGE